MTHRFGIILTVLTIVSAPGYASCQSRESVAQARARFEAAEEHFAAGELAQALTGFEDAYRLMEGHPRRALVLYNIGRINEELGRNVAALEAYRRFLDESDASAPNRAEAERRLRELEARQQLGSDGDTSSIVSPIGIVIAAIGGAAIVGGAVLGGVALASDADIAAMCDSMDRCPPESLGDAESTQLLANAADGLLFGGATVAVTGVVLMFVLADTEGDSPEEPRATVACAPGGCTFAVGGRF